MIFDDFVDSFFCYAPRSFRSWKSALGMEEPLLEETRQETGRSPSGLCSKGLFRWLGPLVARGVELSDLWDTYEEREVTSSADALLQEKLESWRRRLHVVDADAEKVSTADSILRWLPLPALARVLCLAFWKQMMPATTSKLAADLLRYESELDSDCSWTINVLPPTEDQCHGPALWWSSQEERMERTPKDLDSLTGTASEELSSILDCKIFDDLPDDNIAEPVKATSFPAAVLPSIWPLCFGNEAEDRGMIDYNEDWLFKAVCRLEGSVAVRSSFFAGPAALLALFMLYMDDVAPEYREDLGLHLLNSSQIWNASTVILVFLLGFRARQGLARFWEGTGLLHQMRGEWFDTVSNCITFSISARPSKPEQVRKFRHTLVRLMSLCHGSALEEISGDVVELAVIDVMGLDSQTLYHLWECSEVHKFNRVEVCLHLLQTLITKALDDGVLKIPPPILSRVYQTISRGFVNLLNTKKITDTKFPYPFAQIIAVFLLVHILLTPALISASVPHRFLAPVFTFLAVFGMFSLNFISMELENPFGLDANDLPLEHFQQEMNDCLLMLLHPNTDLVAEMDPSGKLDFKIHPSDPSEAQDAKRSRRIWSVRELAKVANDTEEERAARAESEATIAVVPRDKEVSIPASTATVTAVAVSAAEPAVQGPLKAEDVQAMLTKSIHEFNQCIKQWTGSLQTQMADANKAYKALASCSERIPQLMKAAEALTKESMACQLRGSRLFGSRTIERPQKSAQLGVCAGEHHVNRLGKRASFIEGLTRFSPSPLEPQKLPFQPKQAHWSAPERMQVICLALVLPLSTFVQAVLVNQYFWHSLRLGALVRAGLSAAVFRRMIGTQSELATCDMAL
eukprot:s3449_g4.t1